MSVPVDQKEGPHFGNDGLASPSLMFDYVKDLFKFLPVLVNSGNFY